MACWKCGCIISALSKSSQPFCSLACQQSRSSGDRTCLRSFLPPCPPPPRAAIFTHLPNSNHPDETLPAKFADNRMLAGVSPFQTGGGLALYPRRWLLWLRGHSSYAVWFGGIGRFEKNMLEIQFCLFFSFIKKKKKNLRLRRFFSPFKNSKSVLLDRFHLKAPQGVIRQPTWVLPRGCSFLMLCVPGHLPPQTTWRGHLDLLSEKTWSL